MFKQKKILIKSRIIQMFQISHLLFLQTRPDGSISTFILYIHSSYCVLKHICHMLLSLSSYSCLQTSWGRWIQEKGVPTKIKTENCQVIPSTPKDNMCTSQKLDEKEFCKTIHIVIQEMFASSGQDKRTWMYFLQGNLFCLFSSN